MEPVLLNLLPKERRADFATSKHSIISQAFKLCIIIVFAADTKVGAAILELAVLDLKTSSSFFASFG